jgi:hypothetical protein
MAHPNFTHLLRIQGVFKKRPIFYIKTLFYNILSTVPFKVVHSTGDTPFPTFVPLLECFLERTFCDGAQFSYRIFLNLRVFQKRPNFLNSSPTSTEDALRLLSAPSSRFWQQAAICPVSLWSLVVELHPLNWARAQAVRWINTTNSDWHFIVVPPSPQRLPVLGRHCKAEVALSYIICSFYHKLSTRMTLSPFPRNKTGPEKFRILLCT